MNYKAVANQFFNGKLGLCKKVNLTLEEIKCFQSDEYRILCANGLDHISGAWSAIVVLDEEYEDEETKNSTLVCKASCGVQDEDGKELNEWEVLFDRVTHKFEDN
jgi:hypothetical protein